MFESPQKAEKEKQSDNQSKHALDQSSDSEFKSESESKLQAYQLKADKQNQNSPEAVIQQKSNQNSCCCRYTKSSKIRIARIIWGRRCGRYHTKIWYSARLWWAACSLFRNKRSLQA